jgi:organic hydroperoxide reductase OsmC/OhrA
MKPRPCHYRGSGIALGPQGCPRLNHPMTTDAGPGPTHTYRCGLRWSGSTAVGYAHYDRTHRVTVPPTAGELTLSGDPAFGGDGALLNPEQLLVLAASSCQCLSFLAVAARARLDVVAYTDDAEGVMPENDPPVRITRIVLRPHIVLAADATDAAVGRVPHLLEVGHRECYIANSVKTEIVIEPRVERAPTGG